MGERTITVSSRFSPSEAAELDRRRGSVRRGTFLRNLFLGKREPRQIPEVNRERYIETARWAANLNQIARAVNETGSVDIKELQGTLRAFRLALIGMVKEVDSKN